MVTETRTFRDLMEEVQKHQFCGKCGGCVSFCSADHLGALGVSSDGTPILVDEEKCLKCGICYLICPNIHELDEELKRKTGWEAPIGAVRDILSAQTTNPTVGERCTDGGVVTSLLLYLLDHHMIDGALVSRSDGPFHRAPFLPPLEKRSFQPQAPTMTNPIISQNLALNILLILKRCTNSKN